MLENINQKYARLRPSISNGCLILCRGTKPLAKLIQTCDNNAYHNHILVVFKKYDALYCVDANASGVQADRLSKRISSYKGGDFTIIKPNATELEIDMALAKLLKRSDSKWIKYDFINGAKELANRAFGYKFKIKYSDDRDICSDFVSQYQKDLNMLNKYFEYVRISFPQDTIRYLQNATILK
jgi:hypothetical protein